MPLHDAERAAARYLAVADRLLPGRITGYYLVGSAALGAWRPGVSDVDFVAVLCGPVRGRELRRLRVLHGAGNLEAVGSAAVHGKPAIPGTVNGVFVAEDEIGRPVTRIRPIAAHSGRAFRRGRAFDVNPVTWQVLAEHGITVRGPSPDELGLDPEPDRLRAWNLDQLHGHWRTFAERAISPKPPRKPLVSAGRVAAAGLFGPPRMHHTIATGKVIPKETAGEYALDTFAARWHPLIRTALAIRAGERARVDPKQAGEFMLDVIADAR